MRKDKHKNFSLLHLKSINLTKDIDECATPDTCNNGEKCINNMGSYNCLSMCERGLKLNSAIGTMAGGGK